VTDFKIKRGKIMAVDADGDEQAINIEKNVEGFASFDFDDVAAEIELDLENFAGSWVTTQLLAVARTNEAIFCLPDA
jgi:hypothetical protein